jgi:NADH-quinone oxidoreductase subunit G
MTRMVTLTIDGKQVTAESGTLLVNAAKQAGIDIPVFCYHPKMEPAAMCRQCLVEIGRPVVDRATGQVVIEDGKPKISFGLKLETACTTPVSDGMLVLTGSAKAKAAQKEILEFLLTSHPLDCPVCDKGGECPLQNLTMAHASPQSCFVFSEKHHAAKHLPLGDLIWLDRERCIQCGRCIRFQQDIAGEPVLEFFQRGRDTDIITISEPGFDSIFSGNTTDICPVGALTTADFRFGARPWEMQSAASICPHCPVGCNVTVNTRREAKSGGRVAIKRMLPRQNEAVNEIWMCDKGRFGYHFVEAETRLERPLVKEAGKLEPASWDASLKKAAQALASAGSDSLILAGGRLANEDLFTLKQLANGLGAEFLLHSQMGGGELTSMYGLPPGSDLSSLGSGTTILVAACDLYHEAPVWFLRLKKAAGKGATLIVAGARMTKLEKHAAFVVRYNYGDEIETIASLVKKDKISQAIRGAENLVVFYGSDGLGLDGSSALAAACTGLLKDRHGKVNNGLVGVWPHANDQGAWELGFHPAANLEKKLAGKTVYIVGADPAGDDPAMKAALQKAKSVVVQDLFLTETAKLAEVVLPVQAFAEREGTYTSGERRVQRFYPALPARGESRADHVITSGIAGLIGQTPAMGGALQVMQALAEAEANFSAISYLSLSEAPEQWPMMGRNDLYFAGTSYENRQGIGKQLALRSAAAIPTREVHALRPDDAKWLAVPVTRLYDNGGTLAASVLLMDHIGETEVILHPASAEKLGLAAGATVDIMGCKAFVRLDDGVPVSVVLVPRSMGIPLHAPAVVDLKKAQGRH